MIKINDILELVNDELKTHYFKDITFYKVAELIGQKEGEEPTIKRPAIQEGHGNYRFIQDDARGLIVYHRIIGEVENDEDMDDGFGRNSLTTEKYTIKTVFYGQQQAINIDVEDVNLYLAKEFKKLYPRNLTTLDKRNRIAITSIDYDKVVIAEDEGIEIVPESILFAINSTITITSTENCTTICT